MHMSALRLAAVASLKQAFSAPNLPTPLTCERPDNIIHTSVRHSLLMYATYSMVIICGSMYHMHMRSSFVKCESGGEIALIVMLVYGA